MIDFQQLKEILLRNNCFLITTHVNPDADAIGSEIALYLLLKELGKKVYIVNYSETPYNLTFLDKDRVIEKYDEIIHHALFDSVDVIVAIDFNRADRTVKMKNALLNSCALKICIDHHLEPELIWNYNYIDTNYSACGEIIYNFINETCIVPFSYDLAYPLYAAIMTDTGSFRFERTTQQIHMIVAEMLQLGVIPGEVFDKIYDESKLSKFKLLGRALDSLTIFGIDKNVGYMVLYQKDFRDTDGIESDTDGIVNYALSVENVKIGMLFVELKDGFKVSFRSKGNIDVNKLAREYGGGGHTNAAGARFFTDHLSAMMPRILNRAVEYSTIEG
jgi:bifunctional oligoribonuclease and PAP phosphatase NrnA